MTEGETAIKKFPRMCPFPNPKSGCEKQIKKVEEWRVDTLSKLQKLRDQYLESQDSLYVSDIKLINELLEALK